MQTRKHATPETAAANRAKNKEQHQLAKAAETPARRAVKRRAADRARKQRARHPDLTEASASSDTDSATDARRVRLGYTIEALCLRYPPCWRGCDIQPIHRCDG